MLVVVVLLVGVAVILEHSCGLLRKLIINLMIAVPKD